MTTIDEQRVFEITEAHRVRIRGAAMTAATKFESAKEKIRGMVQESMRSVFSATFTLDEYYQAGKAYELWTLAYFAINDDDRRSGDPYLLNLIHRSVEEALSRNVHSSTGAFSNAQSMAEVEAHRAFARSLASILRIEVVGLTSFYMDFSWREAVEGVNQPKEGVS